MMRELLMAQGGGRNSSNKSSSKRNFSLGSSGQTGARKSVAHIGNQRSMNIPTNSISSAGKGTASGGFLVTEGDDRNYKTKNLVTLNTFTVPEQATLNLLKRPLVRKRITEPLRSLENCN